MYSNVPSSVGTLIKLMVQLTGRIEKITGFGRQATLIQGSIGGLSTGALLTRDWRLLNRALSEALLRAVYTKLDICYAQTKKVYSPACCPA